MTGRKRRVVFMGSPQMAVPTLEAVAVDFEVALVVTQPDRPSGRGQKCHPTAVRAKAGELCLPVLAVEDVNAAEALDEIRSCAPDVIVVVSFGQLLRKPLLELPPHGCVNVHFSLLPDLRGAAPVAWAIIRGCAETGVSTIRMVRRMDAGPVFEQRREPVRADDTTATLSLRLSRLGAEVIITTLYRHLCGDLEPTPQEEALATFAPKVTREMGNVDWSVPAAHVDRLIRGLSGQNEAYSCIDVGRGPTRVTLHMSGLAEGETPGPGVAARGGCGELLVGCGEGLVEIKEIQAEGKRRLSGKDFANGYRLKGGEAFFSAK